MYYIISPVKVEKLLEYEMPLINKYGNRDALSFYNSQKGQEFVNYNPMRIRRVKNKQDSLEDIISDLHWLSFCYNQILYVYVMTDNYFFSNFKISMTMYTNFLLCTQMRNHRTKEGSFDLNRLADENRYYKGNDEKLEQSIIENLILGNMKLTPFLSFSINLKTGFNQI